MRVTDIMNRELFHFRPNDSLGAAPAQLLGFGISSAPVLDEQGAPLGVLSLRDCLGAIPPGALVAERMTRPAVTVPADADVKATARRIGETQLHHLVVVDADGRAVGVVSAVDLVRALVGLPARHPTEFPHLDPKTGLTWTDDVPLEADRVEEAPAGPGVLLLVDGQGGAPRVLWGEWTHELRSRLLDLLSLPQKEAALARILETHRVWFRAASLADGPSRPKVVDAVIAHHVAPAAFVSR